MQTSFKISATFLCCVLLGLAAAQAAEQQDTQSFVYKKTKQADLELVVHYPPGWTDHDKRPAIVFFFGGGWENGTIKAFEPQSKHLASRGMVAARADYRVKWDQHGNRQRFRYTSRQQSDSRLLPCFLPFLPRFPSVDLCPSKDELAQDGLLPRFLPPFPTRTTRGRDHGALDPWR